MYYLSNFNSLDPEVVGCFAIAVAIATGVVHIMFAIGVFSDALALERKRPLWFLGSFLWTLATLLTGVIGATAYWLMHRSSISVEPPSKPHLNSPEDPYTPS